MSEITIKDTKKIAYLTNTDKNTGDIASIVIPHDFAVGFTGVPKKIIITGDSLFYGDARFESNIYSRMIVNSNAVKYDNIVKANTNAMLVGPVTVNSGVVLTIETGAILKII
jgi:hypothetical protein